MQQLMAAKPAVMEAQRKLLEQAFTLRGIKDSPPYMHDGRCLTLEDTVEFFNIVLQCKLTPQEKQDLVAFMRQL
jgi:cytochrome c peroxidase